MEPAGLAGVEDVVRVWVEDFVVGLSLCPFAVKPLAEGRVRFIVSEATTPPALFDDLMAELSSLDTADRLGSYPSEPIVIVTMVVASATPVRLADVLVRFRNPETMPNFGLSRELTTALVLVELNTPMPEPESIIPTIT